MIHIDPCGRFYTRISKSNLAEGSYLVVGLLEKSELEKGSRLSLDNLFTHYKLLHSLQDMEIGGTCTLRENRVKYHDNGLPEKNAFNKKARGTMEEMTNGDLLLLAGMKMHF